MQIISSQLADTVWPPAYGSITCLAAGTSVVVVDLTTMSGHPGNQTNSTEQGPMAGQDTNPLGHYITLEADGADIYVAFCDSIAHGNSVVTNATSTVTSNALVTPFTATGAWKIPNGDKQNFIIPPGQSPNTTPFGASSKCRYLAFLTASGSGTLRIYQSSQ